MKIRDFFGDRKFYKSLLLIAIPIMVQNGFTNFVNLLDNIMVGRMGTEPMSGVSIVNQLIFVFNLCIFGGFSGAGIFTAQFYGIKDDNGIRNTCRYKLVLGLIITALFVLISLLFGEKLISLYLNEGSDGDLELTLEYGLDYLKIMLFGLLPYMILQALATTLRECGETVVPMRAGVVAVAVNLVFNWLLIFGNLGFPEMGVTGAAIATVLSRFAELAIVLFWALKHKEKFPFINGLFSSLKTGKALGVKIFKVGSPLLLNEFMWSAGMAILNQCYSTRGLESVAAFNISSTVINVFKVVFLAMGNSVGIIVGSLLGAGKMDEAVDTHRKITTFSICICIVLGGLLAWASPLFPKIYNTSEAARAIAARAIFIAACFMPVDGFKNATYFAIRSGGRTWLTFVFDGMYVWLVCVPIAFILSRFTSLSSTQIFFFVYCGDIIKVTVGTIMIKKKIWLRNIVL